MKTIIKKIKDCELNKEAGFTLIELLVVIAIIGFIAAVAMNHLGGARQRAQNTAKNRLALEYANAFELYRTKYTNKGYPSVSEVGANPMCLGVGSSNTCQATIDGNDQFNDLIKEFIPGPPRDTTNVGAGSTNYTGIIYTCDDYNSSSNFCGSYEMEWYLNGVDQDCGRSSNIESKNYPTDSPQITKCVFSS